MIWLLLLLTGLGLMPLKIIMCGNKKKNNDVPVPSLPPTSKKETSSQRKKSASSARKSKSKTKANENPAAVKIKPLEPPKVQPIPHPPPHNNFGEDLAKIPPTGDKAYDTYENMDLSGSQRGKSHKKKSDEEIATKKEDKEDKEKIPKASAEECKNNDNKLAEKDEESKHQGTDSERKETDNPPVQKNSSVADVALAIGQKGNEWATTGATYGKEALNKITPLLANIWQSKEGEKKGDKKEIEKKEGDKKEGDKKKEDEKKEGDKKKEDEKKEGDKKKEDEKKEGDKKESDLKKENEKKDNPSKKQSNTKKEQSMKFTDNTKEKDNKDAEASLPKPGNSETKLSKSQEKLHPPDNANKSKPQNEDKDDTESSVSNKN